MSIMMSTGPVVFGRMNQSLSMTLLGFTSRQASPKAMTVESAYIECTFTHYQKGIFRVSGEVGNLTFYTTSHPVLDMVEQFAHRGSSAIAEKNLLIGTVLSSLYSVGVRKISFYSPTKISGEYTYLIIPSDSAEYPLQFVLEKEV